MPYIHPLHDPDKRIIRPEMVGYPLEWPKAPSEYVYVFEAINIVGSALFGEEWTGRELVAVSWPTNPWWVRLTARQPQKTPPPPESLVSSHRRENSKPELDEHVKDWVAKSHEVKWEENRAAIRRLADALDWIAQRCRDAELASYWRLKSGGCPVRPMRAEEWNIDNPLKEFVSNGSFKRHCRELRGTGPFEVYVFFAKQDLLTALKRLPDAPLIVAEADLSRLSPYLQGAVRLALEKGYTSRVACESNPVREAEIRAAWPDLLPDVTITKNAVEAMVRVIGFPDNKAIETGLRAKSGKKGGTPKL